ncbi:G-type lectin S-receptor-like serine/threonine-protein kinase B120 [Euphorbia peplus]|nr:G-type lectin S-receptor-like serine/threonine-protein kinase B120 [Euphorbia peplus]
MGETGLRLHLNLIYGLCSLFLYSASASDSLKPGQQLHNNETLVSAGGIFELGFFASTELSNHFLGVWFRNDKNKKAVWVCNRDNPLIDSSGVLKIRQDGNLEMSDRRMDPIMVNQGSVATSNNTIVTLLDSGNLILKQEEMIIWQSFEYPTDTFLPGMRLGLFEIDTDFPKRKYLSSWSSPTVPSRGQFSLGVNPENVSEFNLWAKGTHQKIGFWDGKTFRFIFQSSADRYNFGFVSTRKEVYLAFHNNGNSTSTWFVLASNWAIDEYTMTDQGIEIVHHSMCYGVSAFDPVDCITQVVFQCKDGDAFAVVKGSKPSSMPTATSTRLSIGDCEILCRSNCSCAGFSSLENDGFGCELYYGNRKDLLSFTGKGNVTIYVRGTFLEKGNKGMKKLWWLMVLGVVYLLLMLSFSLYFLTKAKSKTIGFLSGDDGRTEHELVLLSFFCIAASTNNFSSENEIGKGGFGSVYKGKMLSGQEVAVKRLSTSSGQGAEEFKTEVQLLSKLQHVNLVKILGCCVEQQEKILIYEYMPNKSLDSFIFDPAKRRSINWRERIRIIEGIAQGLVYLHKYSRVRIIHRDLKTSNILLDAEMNPKISDFGMARILFNQELKTTTNKVAGTYGYMSPEYGVHGIFSTKSDVYSFGVIVLEILSGRQNLSFDGSQTTSASTLLGYAWEVWTSGRCMELMDPLILEAEDSDDSEKEVMQLIQLGLLCVQDNPEDRPTMSQIVIILTNETPNFDLPAPKQPTFSTYFPPVTDYSHSHSLNYVTFSALEPR